MAAPHTGATLNGGVYLGTVTRLDGAGAPYAEVPRLLPGYEYGPLTSSAGPLAVGDGIVVGFLEGNPDVPVVVARIGGPASTAGPVDAYTRAETDTLLAGKAATPHAAQHATGGADPLTPAAIGAASSTDPRLTDARTPTAHAATHAAGGSDAVTPASIGAAAAIRAIATASGLTGGGDLTADRTLAVDFAASGVSSATKAVRADDARLADARTPTGAAGGDLSGTYPNPTIAAALKDPAAATAGLRSLGTGAQQAAAGNDARLSNARTPTAHAASHAAGGSDAVTLTTAQVTGLDTALAGKAPTARKVNAGTGLTGGGDLTADRTLAVAYGSTAGTAAQGNDPRLADARTPTAHASSHASGGSDALTPAAIGAVATSDSRLTDARTPTAHAASHASGGSDPVTPAAIGASPVGHTHTLPGTWAAIEGAQSF